MKKFRVVALHDDTMFMVEKKFLFFYVSAYVYTSYFGINYDSKADALEAIEKYKQRFTDV